ncbi:SapC family protein [uncultured Ruegeria sp.]|uniref:SapC family protein n=1 Tax=uncultured Ruegeria sp. TaxID=259304 RepID=UPI00260F3FC3|nr:SapC family protein [uncultured Ruegeria sp.]
MAQNGLTPVTRVRHGHRFWRRFTSFDFARGMTECPVVEAEILHAASSLPITFRKSEHGYYPVAVLSMQQDQPTPLVSEHGRWLATYVPSALRCAPFQTQLIGPQNDSDTELLVDETSGLITDDPEDEVFFDKTGKLAPELKKVWAFFRTLNKSVGNTTLLCRVLADMGLFHPLASYQGVEFPCGHFGVDQNALRKIPSAHMSLLASNKGLRLIHAHQISLTHCVWLTQAQIRAHQVTGGSPTPTTSGVSGFLDALVTAQQKENTMDHCWQEGHHALL